MKPWHTQTTDEIFETLGSRPEGLEESEARRRLALYGPNELRQEKKLSPLKIFFEQFTSFLILILLAATAISLGVGEVVDAIAIFAIVLLSAVLGFFQEYRAEQALEALKEMAAPMATVLRGGREAKVPARELVPGDVILLAVGDRVPADARVFEEFNLQADESPLTGESTPVQKHTGVLLAETELGDRSNLLFAGTTITYGRGKAAVVATGMNTELGQIARLVQEEKAEKTPLEKRMEEIGKVLGIAALIVVAAVAFLGLVRGHTLLEMFIWGVSLAVAAVPEALPAVVTGALAIGVQRMAKRRAIVRRLPAVETLGSTTVICTDKTGTMTKSEMTVRRVYVCGEELRVSGAGYEPRGEFRRGAQPMAVDGPLALVGKIGALCNDARLEKGEKGWQVTGDPTEGALLVLAAKAGWKPDELNLTYPRIGEIAFSSERKRMSTVHRTPEGRVLICSKGAPEVILEQCTRMLKGQQAIPLQEDDRHRVLIANELMAREALRVLGVAYREMPSPPAQISEALEQDLTFVGLVGMIDPPREEVKEAIRECEEAGIRVVMITGDHPLTARAVATELGILKEGHCTLTGAELDGITDAVFADMVEQVDIYARVSPTHKLRIVEALKRKGHIVAMTGDGVNDAPALKRADIGVAMGITGTEVTKEASDMVLADDNFATIVAAVEEGRGIFENVRKYLAYLLSCNMGEILVMLAAGLLGLPLPLIAVQILWVNLITDGLPALALGVDPPSPDLMRRPPRPPRESIFSPGLKMIVGVVALLMAVGTLWMFAWKLSGLGFWQTLGTLWSFDWKGIEHDEQALRVGRTMAFTLLVLFEMFNAFNCRSDRHSIFRVGAFANRYLLLAVLSSVLLQLMVIYGAFFEPLFETVPLEIKDWVVLIVISATALVGVELGKKVMPRKNFS